MDALKSSDLGFPNRCSFKYMLATSSCLYAGFGGELQLAVSNCSTYMLYLGEQELLKAGAAKARVLVKLVANVRYYISKNGEVDRKKST